MTAAQKKTDMKGLGLQIALDLMHEKSNKDLITGLKTKTEPGRPNWNKVKTTFSSGHICYLSISKVTCFVLPISVTFLIDTDDILQHFIDYEICKIF